VSRRINTAPVAGRLSSPSDPACAPWPFCGVAGATHDDAASWRSGPAEVTDRWGGADPRSRREPPTGVSSVIEPMVRGRLIQWYGSLTRLPARGSTCTSTLRGAGVSVPTHAGLARHLFGVHGHHRPVIDPPSTTGPHPGVREGGLPAVGVMRAYERRRRYLHVSADGHARRGAPRWPVPRRSRPLRLAARAGRIIAGPRRPSTRE
jgi:hypothetical protein